MVNLSVADDSTDPISTAASRRFYNANIREMRLLCRQTPTNIAASAFGFQPGDFFELQSAPERVVPRIDL